MVGSGGELERILQDGGSFANPPWGSDLPLPEQQTRLVDPLPLAEQEGRPDLAGIGGGQFHHVTTAGKGHHALGDLLKGCDVTCGGLEVVGHRGCSLVLTRQS